MQIVLRAKTKCMRRNTIMKREIKDYVAKSKVTKAYDENHRLREKIMVQIMQRGNKNAAGRK